MLATQIRTPSDLRLFVEDAGSSFFSRESMKFSGDTMRNYGLRRTIIKTHSGDTVEAYELYRRQPVKNGLRSSAYFHAETFRRVFGEVV